VQESFDGSVVGDGLFDDPGLGGGQELGHELAVFEMAPVVIGAVSLFFIVFAAAVVPTAGHPTFV
jgi:hypothetical protein